MTGVIAKAAAAEYLSAMKTFMSFPEAEGGAAATPVFTLVGFEPLTLAFEDPESERTRRVVCQHYKDMAHLNTDELMRMYAADCRLSIGTNACEGTAAIKDYYSRVIEDLAGRHTTLRLFHLDIHGKLAFLTWEQCNESTWIAFGATTFIVLDGLIVWQQVVARERKIKEI